MHIDDNQEEKDNKDSKKVMFIKKLYVQPLVPLPAFLMDLLKDQYRKDSDLQVSIIKDLCQNPLTNDDSAESLQQLNDV